MPVFVVRLFNTVGQRQTGRYGMVLPRFVQAALRDEPIAIHGTANNRAVFATYRRGASTIGATETISGHRPGL